MQIAVDAQAANEPYPTGVEYYTRQLLRHLTLADKHNHYHLFLATQPTTSLTPYPNRVSYRVLGPKLPLWRSLRFPLEFLLHRRKYDLFFSPNFIIPAFAPARSVATFHDLAYEIYPEYFSKWERIRHRLLSRWTVQHASHLIAVSRSTKKDLTRLYKIPAEKISVVYESYNQNLFSSTRHQHASHPILAQYGIDHPYFLFVGTLQGRKGVDYLLQAFDQFAQTDPRQHQLVLVGKKGWQDQRIYQVYKSMQHRKRLVFTGYVPEENLPPLYSAAQALVLPSLYEGFGLPVLEAMACRTAVITTKVSSLPEVGGQAAYYVKPKDIPNLKQALTRIAFSRTLREELIEKGLKNIQRFSWEKAAYATLRVFKRQR